MIIMWRKFKCRTFSYRKSQVRYKSTLILRQVSSMITIMPMMTWWAITFIFVTIKKVSPSVKRPKKRLSMQSNSKFSSLPLTMSFPRALSNQQLNRSKSGRRESKMTVRSGTRDWKTSRGEQLGSSKSGERRERSRKDSNGRIWNGHRFGKKDKIPTMMKCRRTFWTSRIRTKSPWSPTSRKTTHKHTSRMVSVSLTRQPDSWMNRMSS